MYKNISTKELMKYSIQLSKRIDIMNKFPECYPQIDIYNAKVKYWNVDMVLQNRNIYGDQIDG